MAKPIGLVGKLSVLALWSGVIVFGLVVVYVYSGLYFSVWIVNLLLGGSGMTALGGCVVYACYSGFSAEYNDPP